MDYTIECECGRVHRVYAEKGKVKHETEEPSDPLTDLLTGGKKPKESNNG